MFSKIFIERPRFALVISIVISICGLIAIANLPVAQYPQITPPQVAISTSYPGASAEVVRKTIVEPIESQVNGVKNMLYMSSKSSNDGSANITVTFEVGTDGDINTVNVQNRASIANAQLPEEVKKQGVTVKEQSPNMLLIVNLFSPKGTYDGLYLNNYAQINIRDALLRIPGVGDVQNLGGSDYSMRIWLDPDRLASMGLTAGDVISAIQEQNIQVAAGQIGSPPAPKNQQFQYTVQALGRLTDVEEFKRIIIRMNPDGSTVRVKDVAKVELGAQSYSASSQLNSAPCALLAVYQLPEANGLQIADAVKKELKNVASRFPSNDMKYGMMFDTTKFINASLSEVVETLIIAVILVILVVFLFLQDWRSTLIPSVAIPVSLIGTFAFMQLLGFSINLTTLFGLILAIGIVVDDAIVVIENVNRLMDEDKMKPKEAAIETMRQVSGPVIATTLVLLAVFVPVCFMPGITGELYRQFAMTISISVLISSVNALTLSPALCACLLRPEKPKPFFLFVWFNRFFDWLTEKYTWIATFCVKRAVMMVVMFVVLMSVTYKLYTMLPTGFVPNEDQGFVMIDVQLPDAASIPRTQQVVNQIGGIVKQTPGVSDVMNVTGYSMLSGANSSNTALVICVLEDWDKRKTPELSQNAIIAKLRGKLAAIPSATIMPFGLPSIPGIGSTGGFEFVLQDTKGGTPEELENALNSVILKANERPELTGVFSTYRANVPQIFLQIDREKVKKLGVQLSDVFTTLQACLGAMYVNDFNKFGKVYQVRVQAQKKFREYAYDIQNLYVRNTEGDMVPLSTILSISTDFGPQVMNRYNLFSSATINGNASPGYSSGQAMKAMEEVADEVLPDGYKYEWTGMSYQEKLAGNQVMVIFALAITFIYLFLVAQYESWMLPLSIMLSVPVAFFGALGALWMMGLENNIYTQIGFVLLFGLASKTAILIVEFAKEQHSEGKSIIDAAIFAARLRFRAVCMTAVSFVLGVFPLVIAVGAGAVSRRCLGTAVFGGMLVAGIIGTIVIPAFYVIIQRIAEWVSHPVETK